MEELVARVAKAADIAPDQARRAIGLILAFLRKEGPTTEVDEMLGALPGGQEAATAAEADKPSGGGILGGLMNMMGGGGGLMGLAASLTGMGLGTGEMATVGKEIFAYAREKVGDDRVNQIAGAIPGLNQFI